jgi:hypothetical protein
MFFMVGWGYYKYNIFKNMFRDYSGTMLVYVCPSYQRMLVQESALVLPARARLLAGPLAGVQLLRIINTKASYINF